jgi:anti-anti-sigma factor
MQHLAVRTVFTEHQATLVISGEVDICTGPAVERALGEALNQRPERLVLDLGRVDYIDCATLRALAAADRALPGRGKAVIRLPSRAVHRVLELTGMSACFLAEPDARTAAGDRTNREHHG